MTLSSFAKWVVSPCGTRLRCAVVRQTDAGLEAPDVACPDDDLVLLIEVWVRAARRHELTVELLRGEHRRDLCARLWTQGPLKLAWSHCA